MSYYEDGYRDQLLRHIADGSWGRPCCDDCAQNPACSRTVKACYCHKPEDQRQRAQARREGSGE